ncbi:MAG: ABC transporter ATP-binding protein [Bacillota bacterium]|nr:ABC transporter ATP-binding protein [Bacillota bacterium]
MIEIKNLNKQYGKKFALKDVNLQIQPGEIIGLFGENSAGKTTLIKSVLGLIKYEGIVLLDGQPLTRSNIGHLSFATCEHSFFPNINAKDHKEFYEDHFKTFKSKRFDALMEFFNLPYNKKLRAFSTGQQNQFEVILALCQGADYILMDEPFAGNDIFNREDFYKVLLGILDEGETILLSTHLIEEISGFISRAVLIHEGEIVGDKLVEDLDKEGKSLMDYIKETYNYKADRVANALSKLSEE